MMAAGSSVRGLSEVAIGEIGALGGDPPHERPLAPVAIATAAEDHDEPPAGERPQRGERTLERIGRVRVVAQDDAWRFADALHAARHLRRLREPCDDLGQRMAERERRGRGGEAIGHVEVAEERERGLRDAVAAVESKAAA